LIDFSVVDALGLFRKTLVFNPIYSLAIDATLPSYLQRPTQVNDPEKNPLLWGAAICRVLRFYASGRIKTTNPNPKRES
jgi:hypothetical protein